jgi:hypothetical protein
MKLIKASFTLALAVILGLSFAALSSGGQPESYDMNQTVVMRVDLGSKMVYLNENAYRITMIKPVERGVSSRPISGSVGKGEATVHGPFFCTAEDGVVMTIYTNPTKASIVVGVVDSNGLGKGRIDNNFDGTASIIYECSKWGEYFGVVISIDQGFNYKGSLLAEAITEEH